MTDMQNWPANKVLRRDVDSLIPSARNARSHSDAQIAQVSASIREWGWVVPVVVDENNNVIAGHCRVLAARKLGLTEVPVIVAEGWSDAKKRGYMLADNKLGLNSSWDDELLKIELADLKAEQFDISLTGFSQNEFDQLMAPPIDPKDEWGGMPDYDHKDKEAYRSITVHLKDQVAVEEFFAQVGQRFTNKTRFIWFPMVEDETYMDKRYTDES